MTIDYVENRLDGILEAGDWLIDQAVEGAITRNDWSPPKSTRWRPEPPASPPVSAFETMRELGIERWDMQNCLNRDLWEAAQRPPESLPLSAIGAAALTILTPPWRTTP